MKRYAVKFTLAVSSTAATNTMPIGLSTAATSTCGVYDLMCGMNAAVADAQLITGFQLASTYVAGSAFTSNPLEPQDPASKTTATTTLTVGSQVLAGTPFLEIAWNSRATVRWVAVDPDSRILLSANGGTNGQAILYNQQPGTVAGLIADNNLYFAE